MTLNKADFVQEIIDSGKYEEICETVFEKFKQPIKYSNTEEGIANYTNEVIKTSCAVSLNIFLAILRLYDSERNQ